MADVALVLNQSEVDKNNLQLTSFKLLLVYMFELCSNVDSSPSKN